MNTATTILSEIQKAQTTKPVNKEIIKNPASGKKNEFLFILKPEVFARINTHQIESILKLILDRLAEHNFSMDNVRIINAAYLDQFNVIAQHYGVINAAARDFNSQITEEITSAFKSIYNRELTDSKVVGSLETAEKYPQITDEILQKLWSSCEIKRLAGGVYCGEVDFENDKLYIINGFHPPQIRHFIAENRMILTMNLSGDIDWKSARQEFIGNTYPEKAAKGSLRRDIFDKYGKLGFDDVSYVINSLHLSAGPLEALLELQRFNSEFQHDVECPISEFGFGKLLEANFSKSDCDKITGNPTVNFQGKQVSLFDLTEELNTEETLALIKTTMD
ncbi:MAG: hypothetical protein WAO52_11295 [Prolixibacteraceae bacterium]